MSTSKVKREELLTVTDIAVWLRLDPQTVRRMTRRGEVPGAMNLGTENRPQWRFDPKEIAAWLTASRQRTA